VESGLNDGICVPVLFVFLGLATHSEANGNGAQLGLTLIAREIGVGVAVGLGLAFIAVRLFHFCVDRDWITDVWRQLPVVALALGCFAVAQLLGGSGFIASFAGGLLFGALSKERKATLLNAAEGTGETLGLVTWVMFGVAVLGHTAGSLTWQAVVYAVLSLTVLRMLPVFVVLTGSGLSTREKLFMGWFGPRGLASIVFAVVVLGNDLPGSDVLQQTVVTTIVLSILLHGLSANPLVAWLAARGKAPRGTRTG
jgi:NhaP-type Na+/H+ or K+/H+ antiporter